MAVAKEQIPPKSRYGEFQIEAPRNCNGEFEPQLIPKYQRDISSIQEKVIVGKNV